MVTLVFAEEAIANILEIGRYTEETWGAKQRDIYLAKIFKGCESIRKSPGKGKLRRELDEGFRSLRVEKHVVFYYIVKLRKKQEIRVAGILHERMDPSLHLRLR